MLKVFSKSDIGLVRSSNQDACDGGVFSENSAWVVVCDGMGGANGGNIASNTAVKQISEHFISAFQNGDPDNIKEVITAALHSANSKVYDLSKTNLELKGMGTTAVICIVSKGIAHIAHAGDSRAYMITNSGIQQLTIDHSMVQELIKNGDITEQEAKTYPHKNIITRAIGVQASLEFDYGEWEFSEGNLILLCTDGLSNNVDAEQIYQLSKEYSMDCLTEKLVSLAKDYGGSDNITVAVIEN